MFHRLSSGLPINAILVTLPGVIPQVAAVFLTALAGLGEILTWNKIPPLPESLGVAAPFAGVSGDSLLVAGGANFPGKMPWEGGRKVWTDKVWLLDRPDGVWREAGRLPRPLAYGMSVTARDGIICIGGSDAERHYPDVFHLAWKDGKLLIKSLPPLPLPLSGASGALVNDTLYVACGAEHPGEQAASRRAFALDLTAENPSWQELPRLPGKARLLATGAAHGDAFYLFGGVALEPQADGKISRVYLRDAWSYVEGRGWERLPDLPKPNAAAPSPAPVIAGRIFLLAGDDGSRAGFTPVAAHPGFPATILSYSPTEERWSETGNAPAPRATVPVTQWRGMFIIPSGEVRPGVRSPEVWSITAH